MVSAERPDWLGTTERQQSVMRLIKWLATVLDRSFFVQGEEEELPKRHAVSIRAFGLPAGETGTLQGTLSPHCQRNVKAEFQECAPMSWRELTVSVAHMCSAAPVLAFATHSHMLVVRSLACAHASSSKSGLSRVTWKLRQRLKPRDFRSTNRAAGVDFI